MICTECGEDHDEWTDDLEMTEPYFIMGVCFFCRIEIELEITKSVT